MSEEAIKIINQSYHKHMTNNHLAQVNFTAWMSETLVQKYFDKTSINHTNLGRLRFLERTKSQGKNTLVFGRVSHGWGYAIEQDIFSAIIDSKGVK